MAASGTASASGAPLIAAASSSIRSSRRRLLCSCAIERKLVQRPGDLVQVIADAIELDQGLRQRRGIDGNRPAV